MTLPHPARAERHAAQSYSHNTVNNKQPAKTAAPPLNLKQAVPTIHPKRDRIERGRRRADERWVKKVSYPTA